MQDFRKCVQMYWNQPLGSNNVITESVRKRILIRTEAANVPKFQHHGEQTRH